jgi:hypothetical protein
MSIEKKSLISTLKTTKKANVAKEEFGNVTSGAAIKSPSRPSPARRMLAKPTPAKFSPTKVVPAKLQLAKKV